MRPSDTIWRQRSMSTLAQIMACCLTAPSHYLNQCWLITSGANGILHRAISYELLNNQINEVSLKIALSKLFPYLPGANELSHVTARFNLQVSDLQMTGYQDSSACNVHQVTYSTSLDPETLFSGQNCCWNLTRALITNINVIGYRMLPLSVSKICNFTKCSHA